MNLKLLISTAALVLVINLSNAQSSATESGIAIQGIARDNDYTARINETLSLDIEFYYEENASKIAITTISKAVDTDDFGVFSTTVDPGVENTAKFANNLVYMKISEGTTVITDEKLKHVPYAISANNGVPTGSVMPFLGNTAPAGWALCDGSALPNTASDLIAIIGSNAPDLRGMFIRGTGTSSVNGQNGPLLNETQDDTNKSHLHGVGTLSIVNGGSHKHGLGRGGITGSKPGVSSDSGTSLFNPSPIQNSGVHSHTINGSTSETGDTETRPVNYGVNYIIKL